jgi:SAM-dependent methyltransferase
MVQFWNERYGQQEYAYGRAPNRFLESQLAHIPNGKILFPAEGEGRNAVFAAELGWTVDAFDISAEGKRKAERLASERGVSIHYILGTWEESGLKKPAVYDAVGIIFNHFPRTVCQNYFIDFSQALKPGGVLILEVFSKDQIAYQEKYNSGGPKSEEILFSVEEIREMFEDIIDFELIEKTEVILDEGPFHSGPASVIRVMGKRK